jgi:hypothetical protein
MEPEKLILYFKPSGACTPSAHVRFPPSVFWLLFCSLVHEPEYASGVIGLAFL